MNSEIKSIIERNKRVEKDKAWEISFTRRAIIAVMTYLIIVLFLWMMKIPYPWLNALIPTIAFVLSTFSLTFFKKFWLKYIYRK